MNLLALLPMRSWLAIGGAVALSVFLVLCVHYERDVGRAEVQKLWDAEKAKAKVIADKAQAENEAESARRIATLKGIEHDAQLQIVSAHADAASAARAADSLRQRFAAVARGCTASGDPAAASVGASAPAPGAVLGDVLNRVDDAAGQLAAYADAARIAGESCERSYSALSH